MEWAFDHGFGRVQLKTDIRNARSQQAIARLGARYEGVLRRYQRRQDDSVRDTVVFSVTAEDWPTVRDGLLDAALCIGTAEVSARVACRCDATCASPARSAHFRIPPGRRTLDGYRRAVEVRTWARSAGRQS